MLDMSVYSIFLSKKCDAVELRRRGTQTEVKSLRTENVTFVTLMRTVLFNCQLHENNGDNYSHREVLILQFYFILFCGISSVKVSFSVNKKTVGRDFSNLRY